MPGGTYRSIQNPRQYRALRRRGYSKEAAARISNAQTPGHTVKAFDESNVNRDEGGQFSDGGGGGGGKQKPATKKPAKKKPSADEAAAEHRSTVGDVLNANDDERLGKNGLEALNAFGEGTPLPETMRAGMEQAGLVRTDADGVTSLTPEGRRVLRAANQGNADAVGAALDDAGKRAAGRQSRAAARDAKRQEAEGKRQAAEGAKQPPPAEKPKKGGGGGAKKPDDEGAAAIAARAAILRRLGQMTGATKAMRPGRRRLWQAAYTAARASGSDRPTALFAARTALRQHTADRARRMFERASLAVLKDAQGHDRWIAISSTAYRDRDGEIVSTKALTQAVALADAGTTPRGPLRFWHVPGLDLGDCDYQAVTDNGRILVESGTFRSPAYAAALKAAGQMSVSIGFTHPATEPDRDGVFHTIAIFERSLVPQGRAANPFTRITTKEPRMLTAEKLQALKALLGEQDAAALLAEVQQTDKTAQASGVAYKAASAPAEIVIGGVTYAVKAPMPPEAAPEAPPEADRAEDAADGEETMEPTEAVADDDDLVDLTVGDLRAIIAAALEDVIGGISGRMAEMKAQYEAMGKAFGTMQTTKDDGAKELEALKASRDALAAQVAALDNRLKELEGDQPAVAPFVASNDPATVVAPRTLNPAEAAYAAIYGSAPTFPIT